MQKLYVLYDGRCGFCVRCARWLERQPAYLELECLSANSRRAAELFPELFEGGKPEELIVVSDEGEVYRDTHAWIMSLYALEEYREWALRLAHPLLLPLARQAFSLLSGGRWWISWLLRWSGEEEIHEVLNREDAGACLIPGGHSVGSLLNARTQDPRTSEEKK